MFFSLHDCLCSTLTLHSLDATMTDDGDNELPPFFQCWRFRCANATEVSVCSFPLVAVSFAHPFRTLFPIMYAIIGVFLCFRQRYNNVLKVSVNIYFTI